MCIILHVANLPAVQTKSSVGPSAEWDRKVLKALAAGYTSVQLAAKLGKGDPRKTKLARQRIRRLMARSEEYKMLVAEESQGVMIETLPSTTAAVAKRSRRGRTDAAKLIFEATGFHNPKVKHEHSGDIKITVDIPRPAPVEAITAEEPVDADVVED